MEIDGKSFGNVPVSLSTFVEWLEEQTVQVDYLLRQFPAGREDYYLLHPIRFPRPLPILPQEDIKGTRVVIRGNREEALEPVKVIHFLIGPTDHGGIGVDVTCLELAVHEYFRELLEAINKQWHQKQVSAAEPKAQVIKYKYPHPLEVLRDNVTQYLRDWKRLGKDSHDIVESSPNYFELRSHQTRTLIGEIEIVSTFG